MQKKITAEGAEELKLYDKFMCYCKNSGGDLGTSISAAETKIPEVTSEIEETSAKITQLDEAVKKAKADREDAKSSVESAKALRAKTADAYEKLSSDLKMNIDALAKAIAAIEKGK